MRQKRRQSRIQKTIYRFSLGCPSTSLPDAADRRQLTNGDVVVASQFSGFQLRFEFHEILRTVVLWLLESFPAFSFVLSFMLFLSSRHCDGCAGAAECLLFCGLANGGVVVARESSSFQLRLEFHGILLSSQWRLEFNRDPSSPGNFGLCL